MAATTFIVFAFLLCIYLTFALEGGLRKRAMEEDAVAAAPIPASLATGGTPGKGGGSLVPRTHVHGKATGEKHGKHEWTYAEPEWGDAFEKCGGAAQSPIDIRSKDVTYGPKEKQSDGLYQYMTYKPLDGREVVNHGHNVQVNGEFGDLELPDGTYEVKQFHFHFPSEHMINGKHADGEMHIVHQRKNSSGTKDLAVVGLLLQEPRKILYTGELVSERQDEFKFMEELGFGGDGLPKEGEEKPVTGTVDLNTFVTQFSQGYYHYFGSLTTPPCSETVHWYVMKTPAIVSNETIKSFKNLYPTPANNRPVTPLNGRTLVYSQVALPHEYGPSSDKFAKSVSEAASKFADEAAEIPAPAPAPAAAAAIKQVHPPEGLAAPKQSLARPSGIGSGMFFLCLLLSLFHLL